MTDLRTAAQQALEAFRMCVPMDGRHAEVDAAFRNLRAALAEPPQQPVEPVAWMVYTLARIEALYRRIT